MCSEQGAADTDITVPLSTLAEERDDHNTPPEATVVRRAKSYSDLYDIVTAQTSRGGSKKKRRRKGHNAAWEALAIPDPPADLPEGDLYGDILEDELLEASQQEYTYVLEISTHTAGD